MFDSLPHSFLQSKLVSRKQTSILFPLRGLNNDIIDFFFQTEAIILLCIRILSKKLSQPSETNLILKI